MADSKNELPDEETEENASSDEDTSLVSLADSILDIDAEESPEAEDKAAAEPKDSDFDPFSLDEDDSAAFGLEDEAEKPAEGTAENVNAEPEEDDSLPIDETSEMLKKLNSRIQTTAKKTMKMKAKTMKMMKMKVQKQS